MLYFLVHNNIHLIDTEEHLKSLNKHEASLIKIPHKLTITSSHSFNNEYEYPILFQRKSDYINKKRIKGIHSKIDKDLKSVNADDVLFFYTEYEILTHYIIDFFKRRKATVIMLDEGFPTYLSLLKHDPQLNLKDKILLYHLKYILGYTNTVISKINNIIDFRVKDNMVDQVLLYNKVISERDLKVNLLNSKTYIYDAPDDNKVIFLNERFYDYYVNFDEYTIILEDILKNLTEQFEIVYFKFHPREKAFERERVLLILNKFEGEITIITDDRPVELLINDLQIKYLTSFFAQTLLFHSNSNCKPLYLFHKYSVLMQHPVLISIKRTLDNLHYTFFDKWSDIKSDKVGFLKDNQQSDSKPLHIYIDELKNP